MIMDENGPLKGKMLFKFYRKITTGAKTFWDVYILYTYKILRRFTVKNDLIDYARVYRYYYDNTGARGG